MTDVDLNFISRQLERMLIDQRYLRTDVQLLREEVGLIRGRLSRIEATILDRLRTLEERQ